MEEPPEQLRERLAQWGYLLLREAIPASECEALLETLVTHAAPHVEYRGDPVPVLVGEPFFETDPIWDAIYPRIQSDEQFQRFFHQPQRVELMRDICASDPFIYPMKMARISTPRKLGYETPPHQDAHSHRAAPGMCGIWVALHDIDDTLGRVKVLPKSHRQGVRQIGQTQGVGGVQCEIFPGETTWHVSNYRAGDVLIFDSRTVHKAEPNRCTDRVRMSVDTQFCRYGDPVFSTNLEPHHGWRIQGLDWEHIYRNWNSSNEQYYWRDYPNFF